MQFFTVSAVHNDFHLADIWLPDISLRHSKEMRQLPLKINPLRLHFPQSSYPMLDNSHRKGSSSEQQDSYHPIINRKLIALDDNMQ